MSWNLARGVLALSLTVSLSACMLADEEAVDKAQMSGEDTQLVVDDLGSADSNLGSLHQGDLTWCDLHVGNLNASEPYHMWTFEGDCSDVFIDLANRDGGDMFLLLYQQNNGGVWRLIDWNDDDYQGTLNAAIETSTFEGEKYMIVATTYDYLYWGYAGELEYHLRLSCRDGAGQCYPPVQYCGSRGLDPCPEGYYCDWDETDAAYTCGADDRPGVCQPIPDSCPRVLQPVCGCDGQSYTNECYAAMAGQVDVAHDGECDVNGNGEGESCGGIAPFPCAEGLVCDYSQWDFSEAGTCGADYPGVCVRDELLMCTMVWAPVCGCDDHTYGNDCMRRGAHVALWHLGECEY